MSKVSIYLVEYRAIHIRDLVKDGIFIVKHLSTKLLLADALSKTMRSVSAFRFLRSCMLNINDPKLLVKGNLIKVKQTTQKQVSSDCK